MTGIPLSGVMGRTAVVLLGLLSSCLASPTASGSVPQLARTSATDQGGFVGDLDGDGRPDRVSVKASGWGHKGFEYQVELDLSTCLATSSLTVTAKEGGLRIVARDVDSDGDLDLLITGASSLARVGVWINDGHGKFTEGNPATYPSSIWGGGPVIFSDIPERTLQAGLLPAYHDCAGFSDRLRPYALVIAEDRVRLQIIPFHSSNLVGAPKTRSPPYCSPNIS
jgi:hypothetical protein